MRLGRYCAAMSLVAGAAFGQNLVTAKPGLVHYAEGDVLVSGKPVEKKVGLFTTMRQQDVLTTAEGRAEVLLGPGVTLRVAEHSIVKLTNAELTDTRIEITEGSALVEASEAIKENRTSFTVKGRTVVLKKDGIYAFTATPEPSVRVYSGEVAIDGDAMVLKGGRVLNVATGVVEKFESEDTDALYRWAKRRSNVNALANVSGAKSAYGGSDSLPRFGSWAWNPYFNMFTYLPGRGVWNSPFGWQFFSPGAVMVLFRAPVMMGGWGGGGYQGGYSAPPINSGYSINTISPRGGGGGGGMSGGAAAPASGGYSGGGGGGGYSGGGRGGGGGGGGYSGGGGGGGSSGH